MTLSAHTIDTDELARTLDTAWETRTAVPPFSESVGLDSIETAYRIQTRWNTLRAERGERSLGHKIGLTSQAMRDQLGVDEPDYGRLWESRFHRADDDGRVSIPHGAFLDPRVEGELAFLLGSDLDGPSVTGQDVLDATRAVAVSVEVIDTRFTGWKFRIWDTVADNASYGAFTLGPWSEELVRADLRTLGMLVEVGGTVGSAAIGHAVLDHPANAVAWLARRLHGLGERVGAGDIVLSGSLGPAMPVAAGDEVVVTTHGRPPLTVAFE